MAPETSRMRSRPQTGPSQALQGVGIEAAARRWVIWERWGFVGLNEPELRVEADGASIVAPDRKDDP